MVRQPDVAVVVDSSSCLPPELLRKWRITVVPHRLVIGQRSFRDGVDILPAEFYRLLANGHESRFTTSAPEPRDFLEAFRLAGERAQNVLCITVSSRLSATWRLARTALERADGGMSGIRVEVVDSQAAAGASGLLALAAARWASEGDSLDRVMARVNTLSPNVTLLAFLETLKYLRRSGRVHKLDTWAGSLLGVKPLTELRLGEARLLERPRSRARAAERLLEIMWQRVGPKPLRVNVMEADARADAEALARRIDSGFNCNELIISQFTPVMGLHTGPGLLGVAFHEDGPASATPMALDRAPRRV